MNAKIPILETRGVTKRFGNLLANNGVSLQVFSGEIAGLIGPNGAGKTTLFNIISGYIRPDEGIISFQGAHIGGRKPNLLARGGWRGLFKSPGRSGA